MVIGLTGGVGSGKSTILQILREEYGACILEADRIARELMEPGGACYEAVLRAFGRDIAGKDGAIDRAALAETIYADEGRRQTLNALTHPRVREEAARRIAQEESGRLVVYEAALPEEAGFGALCQQIWYVYVPEETRIRRLIASRGYSREKCRQIMDSQLSDGAFRQICTVVIDNGGTTEETRRQLGQRLESLRRGAAAP